MPVTIECDGCGKSAQVSLQVLDHDEPGIGSFIRSYCSDCAGPIRSLTSWSFFQDRDQKERDG